MQISVTDAKSTVTFSGTAQNIYTEKNKICISPARIAGSEKPDKPTNITINTEIIINCKDDGREVFERAKPRSVTIIETCMPLRESICTMPSLEKSRDTPPDNLSLLPRINAEIKGYDLLSKFFFIISSKKLFIPRKVSIKLLFPLVISLYSVTSPSI